MLNVLITGHSGFVGNNLKDTLKDGFNLILPTKNDLLSDEILENIDVVIHLAGKAHDLAGNSNVDDYFISNTHLTNTLFDRFLISDSTVFIFLSSILVLDSSSEHPLTEAMKPNPKTLYAKSKFESELHITNSELPNSKRFYILRTPLIYGKGNKGNLSLLFEFIKKIPFWPLGKFHSKRSFCDIRNLSFVIKNLIINPKIESGIYHVADDTVYDVNEMYVAIASLFGQTNSRVFGIPKIIIYSICYIGGLFKLPFNLTRLQKLTSSLLVSNDKIKSAIKSNLPHGNLNDLLASFENN